MRAGIGPLSEASGRCRRRRAAVGGIGPLRARQSNVGGVGPLSEASGRRQGHLLRAPRWARARVSCRPGLGLGRTVGGRRPPLPALGRLQPLRSIACLCPSATVAASLTRLLSPIPRFQTPLANTLRLLSTATRSTAHPRLRLSSTATETAARLLLPSPSPYPSPSAPSSAAAVPSASLPAAIPSPSIPPLSLLSLCFALGSASHVRRSYLAPEPVRGTGRRRPGPFRGGRIVPSMGSSASSSDSNISPAP